MAAGRIRISVTRSSGELSEATVFVHVVDAVVAIQLSQWHTESEKLLTRMGADLRVETDDNAEKVRIAAPPRREHLESLEVTILQVASRERFEAYLAEITKSASRVSVWCYKPVATHLLSLYDEAEDVTSLTVTLA